MAEVDPARVDELVIEPEPEESIRILHVRPAPAPGALCVYCPAEAEYTCVVCEADVCWEHGTFSRQADEAFCEYSLRDDCHRRQQASLEKWRASRDDD